MKLNEKIYRCRKLAGLSQEALAERLGVSRQAISKWETGEALPEITKLPLLAQVFGVTADWLLDDAAEPASPPPEEPAPQAHPYAESGHAAATAMPEWVDKLPHFLGRLIRQYGWLVGLRIAIAGALFTGMGFVARLMSSAMLSSMTDISSTMMGGFGGGSVTFYDNAGNMIDPASLGLSAADIASMGMGYSRDPFGPVAAQMTNPFNIFCGFIIVVGLVMLVGGGLLAWRLKKWGQESA